MCASVSPFGPHYYQSMFNQRRRLTRRHPLWLERTICSERVRQVAALKDWRGEENGSEGW